MSEFSISASLLLSAFANACELLYVISGPVVVMVLEKRDAVSDWRGLIGPTDAQKAKISHPHRFEFILLSNTSFSEFIYSLFVS